MNQNNLLIIKKNSNSKEGIDLIRENKKFFILKKWNDDKRGLKSISKQINFEEIKVGSLIIKSPEVYSTYLYKNKFEAKMEYVEGCSGSDISLIGSREVSLKIKDSLSMLINKNFEDSSIQNINTSIFIKKIERIISCVIGKNLIIERLNMIKKEFLKDKSLLIPIGPCHGDLTLSNIIISRSGAINLIDFLPTFIESPLWDIVKIYQDLKYGWSYRHLSGPEKESAKIFFLSCIPNQFFLYENFFKRQINLLDALNLARIYPYLKDKETELWLNKFLDQSIKNLK